MLDMPVFGGRSQTALKTTHPDLVRVLSLAIQRFDFMVIQSSRTQEEQEADFRKGVSKAHWLQSAHDYSPSFACDCAPVPLNWSDLNSFHNMADAIKKAANELNIPIVWGGDWKSIKDYPHFELSDWRSLAKQQQLRGAIAA
jgi:peptidoglycan L-alanyl-D-glutamate endopeptidase CwlK